MCLAFPGAVYLHLITCLARSSSSYCHPDKNVANGNLLLSLSNTDTKEKIRLDSQFKSKYFTSHLKLDDLQTLPPSHIASHNHKGLTLSGVRPWIIKWSWITHQNDKGHPDHMPHDSSYSPVWDSWSRHVKRSWWRWCWWDVHLHIRSCIHNTKYTSTQANNVRKTWDWIVGKSKQSRKSFILTVLFFTPSDQHWPKFIRL